MKNQIPSQNSTKSANPKGTLLTWFFIGFSVAVVLIIGALVLLSKTGSLSHLIKRSPDLIKDSAAVVIEDSDSTNLEESTEDYMPEDEEYESGDDNTEDTYNCDPLSTPACSSTVPWQSQQVYCFSDTQTWTADFTAAMFKGSIHYFVMRYSVNGISVKCWLEELQEVPGEQEKMQPFLISSFTNHPDVSLRYMCIRDSNLYFFENKTTSWIYSIGSKQPPQRADYPMEVPDKYLENFAINPKNGDTVSVENGSSLVLHNNNFSDTLINQEYDGEWSIDHCCFSPDGNKLYFDNHGPTACIWEYDLTSRRIAKIVPEHEAKMPSVLKVDKKTIIAYIEEKCIKLATQP